MVNSKILLENKMVTVTYYPDRNVTLISCNDFNAWIEDNEEYTETSLLIRRSHLKESFKNTIERLECSSDIIFKTLKGSGDD